MLADNRHLELYSSQNYSSDKGCFTQSVREGIEDGSNEYTLLTLFYIRR